MGIFIAHIRKICTAWLDEIRLMAKDEGILLFCILLPLAYPVLYSWIYNNEVAHDVPVVIVDRSQSSLSRKFVRMVDASSEVEVACYAHNLDEAKELIGRQKAYGILYFPKDFSIRAARMEQATVGVYCDMSLMLAYKNIYLTAINVSTEIGNRIKAEIIATQTSHEESVAEAPMLVDEIALFNPTGGYGNFILPGVLVLILQQTLLLAIGLTEGTRRERLCRRANAEEGRRNSLPDSYRSSCVASAVGRWSDSENSDGGVLAENERIVTQLPASYGLFYRIAGKAMAYLMLYMLLSAYVLLVVKHIFGFTSLISMSGYMVFVLSYITACIFFAMAAMSFLRRREDVLLAVVFTSVIMLFVSGISWPESAIPAVWKYMGWLFPSTFGVKSFIALGSMGASLTEIMPYLYALWTQTAVYLIITVVVYTKRRASL